MTQTARDVLTAFDALAPTEKQEVVVEILRRSGDALIAQDTASSTAEAHQKPAREFKPIKISGPPLSEDIIRDRQARG